MARLKTRLGMASAVAASWLAAAWLANGCGSTPNAPELGGGTDSGGGRDSTIPSEGGTQDSNAGETGDGSRDGGSSDGTSAEAEAGPAVPAVCDPDAGWGPGTLVPVSTADPNIMGSVTPDELTLVWMSGYGDTGTLWYADRTSTAQPFASAQTVSASLGPFALERVGVSPDGLRIIAISADRTKFLQITRSARPGTFDAPDSGQLSFLNATSGPPTVDGSMPAGDDGGPMVMEITSVGAPVVSSGDTALFYSAGVFAGLPSVFTASRASSATAWSMTGPLNGAAFEASDGGEPVPSGIATDLRTIFYWDPVAITETAAWRVSAGDDFAQFVPLGPVYMFAQPNAACDAIYYSYAPPDAGLVDGAVPLQLYVSQKQ